MKKRCIAVVGVLLAGAISFAQAPQSDGGGVESGVVPASWIPSGPKCMEVPAWQVHEYNPNLYIIRQSGCLDFEKPFLYLLFGKDRGLLLDTGSRNFPVAAMLDSVVSNWLLRNNRKQIEIVAVHSHPHSDHVASDAQLQAFKSDAISVRVIPATIEATKTFYNISKWPDEKGSVDLGDRVIDMIPIPGHSPVSVALYDRRTAILFTGDSLYPGRLYVHEWNDFVKSTQRLVDFTKGKLIAHVLGCHVEQTRTAYLDYPVGTIYQPNEHGLAMSRGDLLELNDALSGLTGPTKVAMRDFSIWPVAADSQPHGKALELFKAREKEQMENRWNQPAPK